MDRIIKYKNIPGVVLEMIIKSGDDFVCKMFWNNQIRFAKCKIDKVIYMFGTECTKEYLKQSYIDFDLI